MKLGRSYVFSVNATGDVYNFDSIGAKGTIHKVVRFDEMRPGFYNAALGDVRADTIDFDFEVDSNNNDFFAVINTVGAIIEDFSKTHPGITIYITGNECHRTTAYQWRLKKLLQSSPLKFAFWGLKDDGSWELFKESESYTAFLLAPAS